MNRLRLLNELRQYPVFDNKIVKSIISKNNNYSKLVIYRLKKSGLIKKIIKNKYSCYQNDLFIAGNIVWPSYISIWSSLQYHNLTDQLSNKIFIITTRQVKNKSIKFDDLKFVFIKVKPNYFFGHIKININDFPVLMADPEKSIIDSLYLRKISASSIFDIIKENCKKLIIERITAYLERINNKTLASRIGYMLDKSGCDIYNNIKHLISANYIPLDNLLKKEGVKNKKWKIMENVKI